MEKQYIRDCNIVLGKVVKVISGLFYMDLINPLCGIWKIKNLHFFYDLNFRI